MKFAFCLSTFGGSPLQGGLERGLQALGHSVVYFHNGMARDFDVFVLFNQAAHTVSYAFPDWPTYDVPVAFVDCAEYGYFRRLPGVVRNYANAFAPGSMSHDTKSTHEQTRVRDFLSGRSFPYFLREFSRHVNYPENYHPIDYPLYHLSGCSDRPSRVDYLGRQNPFWVCWGASHPWRWSITRALRESGLTVVTPDGTFGVEVWVIEEDGRVRVHQPTYFNRLVRARASVSFDGYGSSSFRMTEVLVRTLLLMGPLSIRVREPLVDGVSCVEYHLKTDGEECLSTDIADKLREVLDDPERSFRIYEAGYDHCVTHYTEAATAQYLVDVIGKHDWTRPTVIDLSKQMPVDWEPPPNFQG